MSYCNSHHQPAYYDRCVKYWRTGITTVIRVSICNHTMTCSLTLSGEYQPVYDEFGAVLVLVMALIYRYDLNYHDIGIGPDSFVARLTTKGQQSMLPDDLTDEQSKHLGSWLKGLYDSGNEGLSNDVFASCRPQDFYIIVPTLFQQTVMALSAGVLSFESVKGGLECKFYVLEINPDVLTHLQISWKHFCCPRSSVACFACHLMHLRKPTTISMP